LLVAEPPDLLLLDVMMPRMDGYEVTRRIRAMKDMPFIPILLITAYDRACQCSQRLVILGADEFIRKPDRMMNYWQECGFATSSKT
jgi:CheY-like chemotaxis protein